MLFIKTTSYFPPPKNCTYNNTVTKALLYLYIMTFIFFTTITLSKANRCSVNSTDAIRFSGTFHFEHHCYIFSLFVVLNSLYCCLKQMFSSFFKSPGRNHHKVYMHVFTSSHFDNFFCFFFFSVCVDISAHSCC